MRENNLVQVQVALLILKMGTAYSHLKIDPLFISLTFRQRNGWMDSPRVAIRVSQRE